MEDSNQEIQVPTGFRFLPTDEELVFYYLHRKLTGESLHPGLIGEFNLYSDKNPWEILDKNYTGYFHVFTELRNLSKQKVGRRAGSGTWRGESTKNICDDNGNILWFKKAFVFEIDENKTTDVDCGHWLMTEFSLPGVENYVVCKIYNKEAGEGTTTKPMRSKKRKLQTNTNLACVVGSSKKKKKKKVPNSEYGTSVVPVPQDHNDLTLTVVPELENQNNNPSSDYYQETFLRPHNNTAVESYMEEVIPSYGHGTSDVSIHVPEVQTDPEPEIVQQSDEDDFNEILFLLEDVDNNIDGTETNMGMIPSPEYGTSLVPIPENEDDRTLTHVPEPEQEQVKQSTEDDKNIIPKTTLLESYMEEVIPSSEYGSSVVPIQVTEDQNDPEPGPVAFEQSTEDEDEDDPQQLLFAKEDDPQQLLFAKDFDIAGTENCIEEITSPESKPEQEPVKQSMEDDHTIIPIGDFKFGDEDDDQTTLLPDNFQHLMEPDDINFDQFPFPALHHEDQTSSVPELPLDNFHFPPPEYDCLTSLHCY